MHDNPRSAEKLPLPPRRITNSFVTFLMSPASIQITFYGCSRMGRVAPFWFQTFYSLSSDCLYISLGFVRLRLDDGPQKYQWSQDERVFCEGQPSASLNVCAVTSASFFEGASIPWHSSSPSDPNLEITSALFAVPLTLSNP